MKFEGVLVSFVVFLVKLYFDCNLINIMCVIFFCDLVNLFYGDIFMLLILVVIVGYVCLLFYFVRKGVLVDICLDDLVVVVFKGLVEKFDFDFVLLEDVVMGCVYLEVE